MFTPLLLALSGCLPVMPEWDVDLDGDGWRAPEDCDDSDPERSPDAADICGNGVDEDCDGLDEPCVVGISEVAHTAWRGGYPGGFLGLRSFEIPDVDGDGLNDLIFAALGDDIDRGRVSVITERPATTSHLDVTQAGVAFASFLGEDNEIALGTAVVPDVVDGRLVGMAMTGHAKETEYFREGVVYRVSFAAGLNPLIDDFVVEPPGQLVAGVDVVVDRWVAEGVADEPTSLALLDVGTGERALLVGCPRHDTDATGTGAVYLLSGPPLYDHSGDLAEAPLKLFRPEQGESLGSSMLVFDVDGVPGEDFVAIGAAAGSAPDAPADRTGTVDLFDAERLAQLLDFATPGYQTVRETAAERKVELYGEASVDAAGAALERVDDLDGDGYGELFVAAARADGPRDLAVGAFYLVPGQPMLELLGSHGLADVSSLKVLGEGRIDVGICLSITTADVDRSGALDLVLGGCFDDVPFPDSGEVYVFLDPPAVGVLDAGLDAQLRIEGEGDGEAFGTSLLGLRADPADPLPTDLLVGAYLYSDAGIGTAVGAMYFVPGESLFP